MSPESLAAALSEHIRQDYPPLPGRTNHLRAAVLVPLVWRGGRPVAIATLRASGLRKHAGEVCFPGGRKDETDVDLYAAGCRELYEEVGLTAVRRLGRLSSVPLFTSDYRLEPFVAEVRDDAYMPNPAEVAQVLELPLHEVLAQSVIHAVPWAQDGVLFLSPVFEVAAHVMYGGTAHVFAELLEVVARAQGLPVPPAETGRYEWRDLLG